MTDPTDDAARAAITRAMQPAPVPASMNERAAAALNDALVEQRATAEREAARSKVLVIHAACLTVLAVCVVLRVTLLKAWPDLGALLITGVVFLWGQLGFKPALPVLAAAIATLEPKRLDAMLSLRPAELGNSLSSTPPPPPPTPPTWGSLQPAAADPKDTP